MPTNCALTEQIDDHSATEHRRGRGAAVVWCRGAESLVRRPLAHCRLEGHRVTARAITLLVRSRPRFAEGCPTGDPDTSPALVACMQLENLARQRRCPRAMQRKRRRVRHARHKAQLSTANLRPPACKRCTLRANAARFRPRAAAQTRRSATAVNCAKRDRAAQPCDRQMSANRVQNHSTFTL